MDETVTPSTPPEGYPDHSDNAHLFHAYIELALEREAEGEEEIAEVLYRGANEALREILYAHP